MTDEARQAAAASEPHTNTRQTLTDNLVAELRQLQSQGARFTAIQVSPICWQTINQDRGANAEPPQLCGIPITEADDLTGRKARIVAEDGDLEVAL